MKKKDEGERMKKAIGVAKQGRQMSRGLRD
jgi:hypothetical protein